MTAASAASTGTLCRAPWTSLHLDPEGWVTSCTANGRDPLGNIVDRSLLELWHGAPLGRFREHFTEGGLAPGCDVCQWQLDTAGAGTMYARIYDHLPVSPEPPWPAHIEFVLSSECNLGCVMCSGSFSSTIRRRREGLPARRSPYAEPFFEQLAPFVDHLTTAKFLGGEPFLSRENLRVWELLEASSNRPDCHVTTNGTVFTTRVAEVLEALPMSFAVSMDGITTETVEHIRQGAHLADILANLDRFQEHTERHGTDLSLTFCLMTENWWELADFLAFADGRGLPVYVNTVLSPSRLSLYLLPPDELAEIVAAMDRQTPRVEAAVTRNLGIWHDQLERLRHSEATPISRAEMPVHFPALRTPPTRPATTVGPADAEELLQRWSGDGGVGRLQVDHGGRIVSVDAEALAGVHLDRLVGHGIDEVFIWLQSAFGRLLESTYLAHVPEAGDRILRFNGPHHQTEIRLVTGATSGGGAWWRLAARSSG